VEEEKTRKGEGNGNGEDRGNGTPRFFSANKSDANECEHCLNAVVFDWIDSDEIHDGMNLELYYQ